MWLKFIRVKWAVNDFFFILFQKRKIFYDI